MNTRDNLIETVGFTLARYRPEFAALSKRIPPDESDRIRRAVAERIVDAILCGNFEVKLGPPGKLHRTPGR